MKCTSGSSCVTSAVIAFLIACSASAANYPEPKEDWVLRDFRFHTGEVLPELRLHVAGLLARASAARAAGRPVRVETRTSEASSAQPQRFGRGSGARRRVESAPWCVVKKRRIYQCFPEERCFWLPWL